VIISAPDAGFMHARPMVRRLTWHFCWGKVRKTTTHASLLVRCCGLIGQENHTTALFHFLNSSAFPVSLELRGTWAQMPPWQLILQYCNRQQEIVTRINNSYLPVVGRFTSYGGDMFDNHDAQQRQCSTCSTISRDTR
jgi:hypothetical protein